MSDETTDGNTLDAGPKKGGRPRRSTTEEPAVEENTNSKEKAEAQSNVPAPNGKIVPEGEEYEVQTEIVEGQTVAAETVYRKHTFPNSSRVTYILLASKGTLVR